MSLKRRFFTNSYYDFISNVESSCFVYPDLCSCGHEKYYHSNLDECNSNECSCKRFLP
jgi:hypothetical protein